MKFSFLSLTSCKTKWFIESIEVHEPYTYFYLKKINSDYRNTISYIVKDTNIIKGDVVKIHGKKLKKIN